VCLGRPTEKSGEFDERVSIGDRVRLKASEVSMLRYIPVLLAALLLVFSGVFHGIHTGRWSTSAEVETAAARCESLPLKIGEWLGEEASPLPDAEIKLAEIAGYVTRKYTNSKGDHIQVLLLWGRPGPIAVHTPEVCFPGAGYKIIGERQKRRATPSDDDPSDEFWTARFKSSKPQTPPIRAFWAWSDGGEWRAADHPRWGYARSDYLYKLYVIRGMAHLDEPIKTDPCVDLLNVLVPELRRALSTDP
jgi:hypothetical protein